MHRNSFTRVRNAVAFCVLASVSGAVVNAQQPPEEPVKKEEFVLVKLPGRKPIPNQHLVIFSGVTPADTRKHSERIEADTDSRGVVALPLKTKMRWFQVWHQVDKACPGGAGSEMVFHSSVLFDEGALVLDTCGPTLERLQPYFPFPSSVVHVPPRP
jgi:hypothetical protein